MGITFILPSVVTAIRSLTEQNSKKIKSISLLGSDEVVSWTQEKDVLSIVKPKDVPSPEAVVFKVVFK